jgi:general secretion pathway protein M
VPGGREGRREETHRFGGLIVGERAGRNGEVVMALAIFERWGLNPREQRMATVAVAVVGVMLFLAVPIGLQTLVSSRRSDNDELRAALHAVNGARAQIRDRQERKSSLSQRYGKKAPQLAGFLEQSATAQKLQVTDSVDRPDIPHGKRYVERNTVIHLKKSGMAAIAKFLEAIEKSGYPIAVSRLNVRKRAGEPDSYDVEVGVSAYDRNETTAAAPAEKKP